MKETNVFEATLNRFEIIFRDFANVYVSVSGGKDSSIIAQMANKVALAMGKKFDLMFLDQEAISKYTLHHVEELKQLPAVRDVYHLCMQLEEDNSLSHLQPTWYIWEKGLEDKWVRPMPTTPDVIHQDNHPFGSKYDPFTSCDYDIYALFSDFYQKKHGGRIGNVIGIRAAESMDRRVAINNRYMETWKGYRWSIHQATSVNGNDQIYRFFPIMDWTTADIWKAVHQEGFSYNQLYEYMYKAGMNLNEMRICQPFGEQQKKGLHLWSQTEPESWEKVVNRVSGADFGALYARTKLLGHLNVGKPKHLTYEQYSCFILESLAMTSRDIALWYMKKIDTTLRYHKSKYNQDPTDETINRGKEYISWQLICSALVKNDFWFSRLSFAESKEGYELLAKIRGEIDIELGEVKTKKRLKWEKSDGNS